MLKAVPVSHPILCVAVSRAHDASGFLDHLENVATVDVAHDVCIVRSHDSAIRRRSVNVRAVGGFKLLENNLIVEKVSLGVSAFTKDTCVSGHSILRIRIHSASLCVRDELPAELIFGAAASPSLTCLPTVWL